MIHNTLSDNKTTDNNQHESIDCEMETIILLEFMDWIQRLIGLNHSFILHGNAFAFSKDCYADTAK